MKLFSDGGYIVVERLSMYENTEVQKNKVQRFRKFEERNRDK